MSIVPAVRPWAAKQSLEHAALTLPDQAAEAQNLALPDLDADPPQRRASQAGRREQHLVVGMKLVGKGRFGGLLPGHQPDGFVLGDGLGVGDRHQHAVPQYCDAIAEADDFIPAVRDEEDDRARIAQAGDALGEPGDLVVAERRVASSSRRTRGLRSTARTISQHLLLAKRQIADARAGIDVEPMGGREWPPPSGGRAFGRCCPGVGRRGGEQEIALDAQLTHQGQFLEHAGNALADRVIRVAQSDRLAVERDASLVGNDRAADDLDQGRLAGAVFASKAKNGSAAPPPDSTNLSARVAPNVFSILDKDSIDWRDPISRI